MALTNLFLAVFSIFIIWNEAQAYPLHLAVWKNGQGTTVYTNGDIHNVGTHEENVQLASFMKDHFLKCFIEKKSRLNILFENLYLWNLDLNSPLTLEAVRKGELSIPLYTESGEKDEYPAYLTGSEGFLPSFSASLPQELGTFFLKSIDPRYSIAQGLSNYSIRAAFDLPEFREVEQFLEKQKGKSLSASFVAELSRMHDAIVRDRRKIIETVLGTVEAKNESIEIDIWKTIDRQKQIARQEQSSIVSRDLDRLSSKVWNGEYFLETLDIMAIWEVGNAKPHDQILILAGSAHINSIEQSLEAMGFEKVFSTQSFEDGLKESKLIPGEYYRLKIPVGLEHEMKNGILAQMKIAGCSQKGKKRSRSKDFDSQVLPSFEGTIE